MWISFSEFYNAKVLNMYSTITKLYIFYIILLYYKGNIIVMVADQFSTGISYNWKNHFWYCIYLYTVCILYCTARYVCLSFDLGVTCFYAWTMYPHCYGLFGHLYGMYASICGRKNSLFNVGKHIDKPFSLVGALVKWNKWQVPLT